MWDERFFDTFLTLLLLTHQAIAEQAQAREQAIWNAFEVWVWARMLASNFLWQERPTVGRLWKILLFSAHMFWLPYGRLTSVPGCVEERHAAKPHSLGYFCSDVVGWRVQASMLKYLSQHQLQNQRETLSQCALMDVKWHTESYSWLVLTAVDALSFCSKSSSPFCREREREDLERGPYSAMYKYVIDMEKVLISP